MANPTSNFGWQMPTSTDLVTDLPADFETFGQAVDTSLADLKGGTTGQILSKNSNTDMDFVWAAATSGDITGVTAGTGISGGGTSGTVTITNSMATTITTAGDLIKGTGSGTFDRLGIGSSGQILTVSGGAPAWVTPSGSSVNYQLINTGGTALTGAGTITISGISGKNSLFIYIIDASSATASSEMGFRFNSDTAANYNYAKLTYTGSAVTEGGGQDSRMPFATIGASAGNKINIGFAQIDGANAAGIKTYHATTFANGTNHDSGTFQGFYAGTSAITSISFLSTVGNFDLGTIYVYGA